MWVGAAPAGPHGAGRARQAHCTELRRTWGGRHGRRGRAQCAQRRGAHFGPRTPPRCTHRASAVPRASAHVYKGCDPAQVADPRRDRPAGRVARPLPISQIGEASSRGWGGWPPHACPHAPYKRPHRGCAWKGLCDGRRRAGGVLAAAPPPNTELSTQGAAARYGALAAASPGSGGSGTMRAAWAAGCWRRTADWLVSPPSMMPTTDRVYAIATTANVHKSTVCASAR